MEILHTICCRVCAGADFELCSRIEENGMVTPRILSATTLPTQVHQSFYLLWQLSLESKRSRPQPNTLGTGKDYGLVHSITIYRLSILRGGSELSRSSLASLQSGHVLEAVVLLWHTRALMYQDTQNLGSCRAAQEN